MHDKEKQIVVSPMKSQKMEREYRERMKQDKTLRDKVQILKMAAD